MKNAIEKTPSNATIDYLQAHNILSLSSISDHQYYDKLINWQKEAEGAFSRKTWLSFQYDWKIFLRFCRQYQLKPLPASASTIRYFILSNVQYASNRDIDIDHNIGLIEEELANAKIERSNEVRKISTINRYVSTIGTAHRGAEAPNPTLSQTLKLALKKARRVASIKQEQAQSISFNEVERIRALPNKSLRELLDTLIVSLAFDTGLRRHRLGRITVSDLILLEDGNALIEVERDKTDIEPKYKAISRHSLALITQWRERTEINQGPLLRAIKGNNRSIVLSDTAISGDTIQSAMRRCMKRIGASPDKIKRISGHSCRVGGAQYLRENEMSTTEIMHYGDWKSPIMPLRYTKHLEASKSGMALLFEKAPQ